MLMAKRRGRGRRGRGAARASAKLDADFWGSTDKLPSVEQVKPTPNPYAVVKSLGRPPFMGHEAVSEHYLRAVYTNAVKLAEALAVAGDIAFEHSEAGDSEAGDIASEQTC